MISVADLVVQHLRAAGVRFLFGMPGGGSNLDVLEAAGRAGLPFVLTGSETAGALAAMAQAEILGSPGACLTTLGPGVASVVNGAACAWLDRAPLLLLTDSHPSSSGGRFEHQRLDHGALLGPVTKWSATLSAGNADDVLREAIARATADPPGPVHIECPSDVLSATVAARPLQPSDPDPSGAVGARAFQASGCDRSGSAESLALHMEALLAAARRPLLLVGLGARRPADAAAIRSLCASHRVPALVTYKAKGVLPDDDPHFAGLFTNGAIERPIVARSDLLIGVGLDPVELIPRRWPHPQPIVNIARSAADEGQVPFASQLVSDVAAGARTIADHLPVSTWDLAAVRHAVVEQRDAVCPPGQGLAPHRVVQIAAAAAASRARVTIDAGAHMFPATMLWPVSEPSGMLISNGLSTMGFALPAAIGAALLDRERPVVALIGDGGLLMCAGELLTAVRERLHVVVIVFADASLSLIDVKQRERGLVSSGVSIGEVAWPALAEAVGAAAHVATTDAELERALARALAHRGPSLVGARIDPGSYPATLRAIRG